MDHWIYLTDAKNKYRYALGEKGERILACVGVNPSTAAPGSLDPTMQSVKRIAAHNGFDGWLMFNIYPQRATQPQKIHKRAQKSALIDNRRAIEQCLQEYKIKNLWAAWGDLAEVRPYFKAELGAIVSLVKKRQTVWWRVGALTKKGHPRHPLYKKATSPLLQCAVDDFQFG